MGCVEAGILRISLFKEKAQEKELLKRPETDREAGENPKMVMSPKPREEL